MLKYKILSGAVIPPSVHQEDLDLAENVSVLAFSKNALQSGEEIWTKQDKC